MDEGEKGKSQTAKVNNILHKPGYRSCPEQTFQKESLRSVLTVNMLNNV